jgi:hypothetical protein
MIEMTKQLFILQRICFIFLFHCKTILPNLIQTQPEISPFYRIHQSGNDVTTTLNEHVILHLLVTVNCKHRHILPIAAHKTNWSISLDEIEGFDYNPSKKLSIFQSFDLEWTLANGLANISVILPSIPFRPILISLFQNGNLVTRRLANIQPGGSDKVTRLDVVYLYGVIDDCLVQSSIMMLFSMLNLLVLGILACISIGLLFCTVFRKRSSIEEVEKLFNPNHSIENESNESEDEISLNPPIIYRYKVDPEMRNLQPLRINDFTYLINNAESNYVRGDMTATSSQLPEGSYSFDCSLKNPNHLDSLCFENFSELENLDKQYNGKSPDGCCFGDIHLKNLSSMDLNSLNKSKENLQKGICCLNSMDETEPQFNDQSLQEENSKEVKVLENNFHNLDVLASELDASVTHVHDESQIQECAFMLGHGANHRQKRHPGNKMSWSQSTIAGLSKYLSNENHMIEYLDDCSPIRDGNNVSGKFTV